MGFLTTVTFYNDGADQIKKHPEELAEALTNACMGVQRNRGFDSQALGNHANLITLQKPRHADDNTLYMHAGNTVIDIEDVYKEKNEWAINAFINQMAYHLKELKKLKKEIEDVKKVQDAKK